MINNQNSNATIILVSNYDWCYEEFDEELQTEIPSPKECIHEIYVQNIEDMAVLFHRFGSKAKYKKPTDKNWYTYRAMMNRLFKKEIAKKCIENEGTIVAVNDIAVNQEPTNKVIEYLYKKLKN